MNVSIGNVLDGFDAVEPLRIIQKIKLHLLTHLPEDIRRFGPAIRFSTEIYEAYNSVFRQCSIFSNHISPSRDISLKFSSLKRVKHIFSGGYLWDSKRGAFRQAERQVLQLIRDEPSFQRHLGWVTHLEKAQYAGQITEPRKKSTDTTWAQTKAAFDFGNPMFAGSSPANNSLWRHGDTLTARNGCDMVRVGSWVFAGDHRVCTTIAARELHVY